jgi:hypothetical protein
MVKSVWRVVGKEEVGARHDCAGRGEYLNNQMTVILGDQDIGLLEEFER